MRQNRQAARCLMGDGETAANRKTAVERQFDLSQRKIGGLVDRQYFQTLRLGVMQMSAAEGLPDFRFDFRPFGNRRQPAGARDLEQ
jgi:hypothetical protein